MVMIMGDERRNVEFAKFICKQFPKAKSVLVVADGKGELSRKLANKGMAVRAIENSPRFEERGHPNIKYTKGWFAAEMKIEEDLIVAMHPDEATGEVMLAATNQNKPFAVVPCCRLGRFSENVGSYPEWIARLKGIFPKCKEFSLRINGRSIVLYAREN
jgi:hypothetical protein